MNPLDHLIIAPIVLPLVAGGLMLLLDGRKRPLIAAIGLLSAFGLVGIAVSLVITAGSDPAAAVRSYRLGDWPAQFGITLVADRLSVLMLLLTSILGCTALVFSLARWHGEGSYFHPLFQFLLMGLNGAFLTGDLFNLFVFFEVLLAASYGLALHGTGHARVRAGLHYIAVNLAASLVFLIGVSLIYGSAGTLNMMDLARRVPELAARDRGLVEIGASILGIAFLVKAAAWPLGFWLPGTYAAASAPVAALFSIMTKIGIYAVLRVGSILTGPETDGPVMFGAGWLLVGGMATVLFASLGMIASQELSRLAGFSVLVSSGSLLAVIGAGEHGIVGPGLLYLVVSTLSTGAFFLLIELIERGRAPADDILAVTMEAYGIQEDEEPGDEGDATVAVPGILAVLGAAFIACAILLAGLPPLSGFVAKFAILAGAFGLGETQTAAAATPLHAWLLLATLLLSGFVTVVAMVRAGIRAFWASVDREAPHVRPIELAPVLGLLLLCVVLTVQAGPAMRFMQDTADSLRATSGQARALFPTPPPDPRAPDGGTR